MGETCGSYKNKLREDRRAYKKEESPSLGVNDYIPQMRQFIVPPARLSKLSKKKSQVIIENLAPLSSRRGKRKRSNFNRVLNRSQHQKIQKVLEYKMAVAGLPKAKEVPPGYTS